MRVRPPENENAPTPQDVSPNVRGIVNPRQYGVLPDLHLLHQNRRHVVYVEAAVVGGVGEGAGRERFRSIPHRPDGGFRRGDGAPHVRRSGLYKDGVMFALVAGDALYLKTTETARGRFQGRRPGPVQL